MQPAASQSVPPPPVPTGAAHTGADGAQSDAAEKHAKRTACLKDAKSKKLVGPQKTAFLKNCMAADAPQPLTSASSSPPG